MRPSPLEGEGREGVEAERRLMSCSHHVIRRAEITCESDGRGDSPLVSFTAEAALWVSLPATQPIGPYVVDFFCPEAKLIIEVDGGQHDNDAARDAARTRWLEKAGHRVVRF